MKICRRFLPSFLLIALFVFSCKKDQPEPEPDPVPPSGNTTSHAPPVNNAVCISFENVVGADSLILDNTYRYINANGDSFACHRFEYYISNVSFTDDLGNTWYEPESYHLVNAEDSASCKVWIDSMPAGNYVSVHFMIGVDSARNVSGTQTGALDPANGMFWTWTSGYIMAKFEGHSPVSTAGYHLVIFHSGGFSGQYATQRWITPSFNSLNAFVTNTTVSTIHMKADVLEWFQTPNIIDFSATNVSNTPGPVTSSVADNYMDMFTVTGIDN